MRFLKTCLCCRLGSLAASTFLFATEIKVRGWYDMPTARSCADGKISGRRHRPPRRQPTDPAVGAALPPAQPSDVLRAAVGTDAGLRHRLHLVGTSTTPWRKWNSGYLCRRHIIHKLCRRPISTPFPPISPTKPFPLVLSTKTYTLSHRSCVVRKIYNQTDNPFGQQTNGQDFLFLWPLLIGVK
jgi:hypothetical protein